MPILGIAELFKTMNWFDPDSLYRRLFSFAPILMKITQETIRGREGRKSLNGTAPVCIICVSSIIYSIIILSKLILTFIFIISIIYFLVYHLFYQDINSCNITDGV